MKSRRFQPLGEVLEGRLALTAFADPFTLLVDASVAIRPRDLNLTGRAESRVAGEIARSFGALDRDIFVADRGYVKAAGRPGADPTALVRALDAQVSRALDRLSTSLSGVSREVPYGHVNLNPVLHARVIGASGVTDTTTKVDTPSLEAELGGLSPSSSSTAVTAAIRSSRALVTSDVKDYIHLGVVNNYFRLTRGAFLPPLS